MRIPKAVEAPFEHPATQPEEHIKALIDEFRASQAAKIEQELFAQRKRLADAERTPLTKTTKLATESRRIASSARAGSPTCDARNWKSGTRASIPARMRR